MMLTLKLKPARATLITTFMKSYLALTAADELVYYREMERINPAERDSIMEYTSEWEDKGIEKGLERSLEQGRSEERLSIVKKQLQHRFGPFSIHLSEEIGKLSSDQLSDLAEALLDFKTFDDAQAWLDECKKAGTH